MLVVSIRSVSREALAKWDHNLLLVLLSKPPSIEGVYSKDYRFGSLTLLRPAEAGLRKG